MAATVLAKDLLFRISAELTDAPDDAGQFTRWTERELVAWLNDAQAVVAKYLPASASRIDAIKLQTGTKQSIEKTLAANIIPGDGSSAVDVYGKVLLDIYRNMGSNGSTPGAAINLVPRDVLDNASPGWHTSAATAVAEYIYDPRTPKFFYVNPGVKAGASVWIEVAQLINPAVIPYSAGTMGMDGSSTVLLSIDDQFVDDLVSYIMARGHLKEATVAGNYTLANTYISLFTSGINAQAMAMTGVNPNLKTLPLSPQYLATAS